MAQVSEGWYKSYGTTPKIIAGPTGITVAGLPLVHRGASRVSPTPILSTGAVVNEYRGRESGVGMPAYGGIEYRDLYPGITLRLSFRGRRAKIDYVVQPHVNPESIRFRYDGVTNRVTRGGLIAGLLRSDRPAMMQDGRTWDGDYVIESDGWVRFKLGRIPNPNTMLVIDPYVSSASAYFGGAMADTITSVAADAAGNIYVAGWTESTDFPANSVRARKPRVEAFVLRLHPVTLELSYATYLGGSFDDRALAVAPDGQGNVYVVGQTASPDFPSTTSFGGARDGFVARLSATGALEFARLIGGGGTDALNGVAVANNGVWVVGETDSANMPIVGSAIQANNMGRQDAFLARLDASGNLIYSTYWGGSGDDRAVALAVGASGEIYITGGTTSTNLMVLNAFRSTNAGLQDAFVARFSSDGTELRYSTYLGGSAGGVGQDEVGNWIGVDALGAAYVVGITGSTDFPITAGALQPTFGGGVTDAFTAKLSVTGALLYSTYYGGSSTDEGWTGAFDGDGNFVFAGNTSSPNLPIADALQSIIGGSTDGFLARMSSTGALLSATYLGGTSQESLSSLAVVESSLYVGGITASSAWLPSGGFKGWYDGWVMKLTENPLTIAINSNISVPLTISGAGCSPSSITAPGNVSWKNGASCTVGFPSPQSVGSTRYSFQGWADGGSLNPRTIVASLSTPSYTMQWGAEHQLTRSISPTGAGTITGTDGYYTAGSSVQLTATANAGYQFTGWSGNASGPTNPLTLLMDAPKTVTANFNGLVTFNSTPAVQITTTGTGCAAGTYTTPITLGWTAGTTCTVSFSSTLVSGDTRWVFSKWADGPTTNPRSIVATGGAVYSLQWNTEYRLTRTVTPTSAGSITGSDGFYAAGTAINLSATASTGYEFSNWSGDAAGSANPFSLVMAGPKNITANFSLRTTQVTIDSTVSSLQFTVTGTGCNPATYYTPQTFTWAEGTVCSISTPATQGGDVRWVFTGWTDNSTANPRSVTASTTSTYVMRFDTQYKLTRSISGQGTVSGTDGFFAAGSSIQLTATPSAGNQFTGWSGNVVTSANPVTFALNSPATITANFSATPTSVSIGSNVAAQFSVSGAGCPTGSYIAPVDLTWTNGTGCNVTIATPQGGADTRWVFSKWADGPTSNPRTLIASPGAVYTLNWSTEHRLTRTANGSGTVSGADGFYASGSALQLSATASSGYQFTGWSGSATGTTNPLTITMDAPKSVAANFTAVPVGVRIDSPVALTVTVSGTGCPAGTYSAPTTLNWTNGTACSINVLAPPATADTRMTFSKWSDGVVSNPRTITSAPGAVYTVVLSTEYKLTRTVQGQGSISGIDGFFPAGTALQLTATSAAGYQFAGWSGSAAGSANPLSISMNGPKTVTATFAVATANVVIDSNAAAQFTLSGAGCPAGTYTAPITLSWTFNLSCVVSVSTQGNTDTRLLFLRWSDGSTSNPRNLTSAPGAGFQLVMETQHRLTRSVTGSGLVSGSDGFYAAGSDVQLTATPASGYLFSGWSGAASGSANPIAIRMNGPTTVTANFTEIPIPGVGVDAFEPLTGSGPTGTFTATFSHGGGANQHYLGYILLLPTPNIVQYTAKGSCLIEYNRISNGMRLINDAGDNWLGPISGVVLGPNAGTLTNAQCTVNLSGTTGRVNGTIMTVSVPVTFRNGITPVVGTFLQAFDVKGKYTGMTQFGNWTPAGGTPKPGVSITANASTTAGASAVYTITTTHTAGAGFIGMVTMLISSAIIGGTPCQVFYFPGGNILNLVNDAGTAMVSPSGIAVGTPGTLANGRCSVNTGQATRSISGNNVTVSIPMSFQPGAFGGFKRVYVNAFDGFGELTHWVQAATLNVQ